MIYVHIYSVTNCTGTVIEGPRNVTYLPNLTPLPIELTCNVTGTATWTVNGSSFTIGDLTNGELLGHSRTGTNILVNSPVNNTEYICISTTNDGDVDSDPAYIIIAGEHIHTQVRDSIKLLQHCILAVLCKKVCTTFTNVHE